MAEKKNKKSLKNSVTKIANLINSKNFSSLILLNYFPEFEKFLYWLQQLTAESLGKNQKGLLPLISNVPKDHHSLLQLYLDGPKDKLFYIFNFDEKGNEKVNLKNFTKINNFLDNKKLVNIKDAQRKALINSLNKKIPFKEFIIKSRNEKF